MKHFVLYVDFSDLMTIANDEDGCGWPGGYWSSGLFVTDAWALTQRQRTELDKPTYGWADRLEWPEPVAAWSSDTGKLAILDEHPGMRAERYLGMTYDERRWAGLSPAAFRVAILAAASCSCTASTAAQALLGAQPAQRDALSKQDLVDFLGCGEPEIRQAAIRYAPHFSSRVR
jgi:hypothetical protein